MRAFASAQHPIALAAALVLLLPLAIYLYQRQNRSVWLGAAALLTMGALATGSRTTVLMLMAELIVFLWLKRKDTVRLLPLLVPLIVACQVAMPGTLGTFKSAIFPEQGIITEQEGGGESGSGRVADLGPGLDEFAKKPFFGTGFGTRLTSEQDPKVNARILDNEWLGLLIEVGALGVLSLLWLYGRTIRRLGAAAKRDDGDYGILMAGAGGGDRRLCRVDVHLRRLLLHPGHLHVVHLPRLRGRGTAARPPPRPRSSPAATSPRARWSPRWHCG